MRKTLASLVATTLAVAPVSLIAVVGAAPLSGCSSIPQGPNAPPVASLLSQVLGAIQAGCRMVADANAILALINTFPAGTAAVTIAKTVCAAVGTGGGGAIVSGGPYPTVTVNGIAIRYAPAGSKAAAKLKAGTAR